MKVYIVQEYQGWDDEACATTVAVYTDEQLAADALALLGERGEGLEMEVSEEPARDAERLILHGAVRTGPPVPMTFRGGPLQREETVQRVENVIDYRRGRSDLSETLREFTSYGWGPDGGGLEGTFASVMVSGTDHAAVKERFDTRMTEARQHRWDAQ